MASPVAMMQAPGDSSRWFVVQRDGQVLVFPNIANPGINDVEQFVDLRTRVLSGGERGLLGMAFHPNFGNGNFDVFVSYTRAGGAFGESVVSRFQSNDGGLTLDDTVEDIFLTITQENTNHNGGQIAFGPDNFLYAGWGDGGGGGDPFERAQDNTYLFGTMTRIDVDNGNPYAIPADNPFVSNPNLCNTGFGGADCPEIFAFGLRNPWRWSFDRQTGDLWVGDVGQGQWEEVDLIVNGGDYGWDDREGAHCFEPATGCDTNSTDPITEYSHALGNSITGGYVYRGPGVPELQGQYIFGDFGSGRVWVVASGSPQGTDPTEILDTPFNISSFVEDNDGEIYIIHFGGAIHQIVDAP